MSNKNIKLEFDKIIKKRNSYIRSLVIISIIAIVISIISMNFRILGLASKWISFIGLVFNLYLVYRLINDFKCPNCNNLLSSNEGRYIQKCDHCKVLLK